MRRRSLENREQTNQHTDKHTHTEQKKRPHFFLHPFHFRSFAFVIYHGGGATRILSISCPKTTTTSPQGHIRPRVALRLLLHSLSLSCLELSSCLVGRVIMGYFRCDDTESSTNPTAQQRGTVCRQPRPCVPGLRHSFDEISTLICAFAIHLFALDKRASERERKRQTITNSRVECGMRRSATAWVHYHPGRARESKS